MIRLVAIMAVVGAATATLTVFGGVGLLLDHPVVLTATVGMTLVLAGVFVVLHWDVLSGRRPIYLSTALGFIAAAGLLLGVFAIGQNRQIVKQLRTTQKTVRVIDKPTLAQLRERLKVAIQALSVEQRQALLDLLLGSARDDQLARLAGRAGRPGARGPSGAAGAVGRPGVAVAGPAGPPGPRGPRGARGPSGARGLVGARGRPGQDGQNGQDGVAPSVDRLVSLVVDRVVPIVLDRVCKLLPLVCP